MGNTEIVCRVAQACTTEGGKRACADTDAVTLIVDEHYAVISEATDRPTDQDKLNNSVQGAVLSEHNQSMHGAVLSRIPVDQLYSEPSDKDPKLTVLSGPDQKESGRKPFLVGVQLGQNSLPLAITVSPDDDPSVLTIDDVFYPGLIADWNSHHSERLSVFRGDIIIGVNSFAGNGSEMLEVLSEIEGINRDEMLLLHIKPGVNRVLENFPREFSRDNAPPQVPQMTPAAEQLIKELPKEPPVMLTEDGKLRGAFIVEGQIGPGNMNLGIAIGLQNHPHHLTIEALWSSGLIARWNQANTDKQRVRTGDLITGVNNTIKGCIKEQILNEIDDIQKNAIHQNVVLRLHMEPGCMKVKQNIIHGRAPAFY